MSDRSQYLYRLTVTRLGQLTDGPTEAEAEVLGRHFAYLADLCERGTVLLAGRTTEDDERTFGIVILEAADEAAARRLMEDDPAVAEGVMRAALHPFRVALPRVRRGAG